MREIRSGAVTGRRGSREKTHGRGEGEGRRGEVKTSAGVREGEKTERWKTKSEKRWRAEREEMSSFSLYYRNSLCLISLMATSCPETERHGEGKAGGGRQIDGRLAAERQGEIQQ